MEVFHFNETKRNKINIDLDYEMRLKTKLNEIITMKIQINKIEYANCAKFSSFN